MSQSVVRKRDLTMMCVKDLHNMSLMRITKCGTYAVVDEEG
jgi:hypothetical protein